MACSCNRTVPSCCEQEAGGTIKLRLRINALTQAATSTVRVDVARLESDDTWTPINSSGNEITDGSAYANPSVASTVFDTLQAWSKDSTGFNVQYRLVTPARDNTYEAQLTITLASGDVYVKRYEIKSI